MSATATDTRCVQNPLSQYVAVRTGMLRSVGAVAADIFVQYEPMSRPMLYCRAGIVPNAQQFGELDSAGITNLYVRASEFCEFSNGLLGSLEGTLRNDSIPSTEKFAAMQLAVAVAMDQTLRLVDCGKFRTLAEQVGKDLVMLLGDGELVPRQLYDIARHDFGTFTHATNVSSYCVMLAEEMGIADREQLQKIAAAAILHDLGKRFIPASILAKVSRLTPEEREIIETHPQRGYEELCGQPQLEFGQLMMVYQHHEHVDGTGYPVGVPRDEIHPWARMLAVVDVFDAMTARRPYRRSVTPDEVLYYQRKCAGTHFDCEVVECWMSVMSKT